MRAALLLLSALTLVACGSERRLSPPTTQPSAPHDSRLHHVPVTTIEGASTDLSAYRGKHLLIVNVASKCGYTPQYAELQTLHETYGDRVAVLGFPSNDFMNQEPGDDAEISEFCEKNYGVTFPLFSKVSVRGHSQHPLYDWLSDPEQNGWNSDAPSWNFCKYLISPDGALLKFYGSAISPLDPEIIGLVDPSGAGPRTPPADPKGEML